ncbi:MULTISPECIES: calmodulin-binding protein [unclassified Streptomyces]|uniref:BP74-related protein n=1 Tax=unclassified Streptomyces TaxID=2593676 RepID=UPI0008DE07E2|nr:MULTISPECIES: calmodulin-binding protein [unclassified Streptomyces]OII66912.1 calmodulin-binding protein [Streptomyces sp. CC77]
MRRITQRISTLTATALMAFTSSSPAQGRAQAAAAYFEFTDTSRQRFVIKLTDPARIGEARALLSSGEDKHVMGRIVKRRAPYNARWSYHLAPDTINFFHYAVEVCDATIPYVEEHVAEVGGAFLPGGHWCPWTSRLVREVPPPERLRA